MIIEVPALGGPEQRLFEAGPEMGGWVFTARAYGLSWTRTVSTWSSVLGAPPVTFHVRDLFTR